MRSRELSTPNSRWGSVGRAADVVSLPPSTHTLIPILKCSRPKQWEDRSVGQINP